MSETATAPAPKAVRQKGPRGSGEFDSRSVKIEQKPVIVHPPISEPMPTPDTTIQVVTELPDDEAKKIKFNEDPIKILIHRNPDPKFSPGCTDLIAINGIKAEMLFKNGWVQMGYLPRGQSFYTKRKYVEVLARAKQDTIHTTVIERDNEDPRNLTERVTTSTFAFSVLEDKNPLGAVWLEELLRQQA